MNKEDYKIAYENVMIANKMIQEENKQLNKRLKVLENVLVRDKFNFSKPQLLTFKVEILKSRINKAIEWIYIVQQDKDNKHLEPIINTDELDGLLEILKGDSDE